MSRSPMNAKLRPEAVLRPGELRQAALPLGDIAAKRQKRIDDDNAVAAEWFDAAVGAYGKASALAAELGVTEAYVSEMRCGKRTVALRHLLPLLKHEASALVLLGAMSRVAGLAPPRPVQRVTREQATEATAQAVRRVTALWQLVRREVADQLGADEEQVEGAFLEVQGAAK